MSVGGNKWSCLRFQEKFGTQNLELGMSSPSHPIPSHSVCLFYTCFGILSYVQLG